MTLVPLPALADNCIWMLQKGRDAIEVDPGDATPVFDALGRAPLQLAAILVTRPRADGVDSVAAHHEDTLAHLRFAQMVEPRNPDPTHSTSHCDALGARGEPPRTSFAAAHQWKNDIQ
jgi:hydroxyacylglutathione hydrolase